ncbi:MAG: carbohydrate ABC transporter permease [Bacilli bacterium]
MTAKTKRKKPQFNLFMTICFIVLVLYCLLLFAMLGWTIINSFKNEFEFLDGPLAFPQKFSWTNYAYVLKNFVISYGTVKADILNMFGYTIIYAGGCALVSTAVVSAVAYATSTFKNWFISKLICGIVLFAMIFPVIGSQASEMQVVTNLGIKEHFWGMFILKFNFLGIYFLIFYATFSSMSKTYREAAIIDGANHYQIMFKVYYPQVLPILTTIFLLYFVAYWNDYQTPLLYLKTKPTISYGLFMFYNNAAIGDTPKLAACLVVMIPILIIFLVFRKRLMNRISLEGGIKE